MSKNHPPGWSTRLLKAFLRKEYLEEIQGDLEEGFVDSLEQHSLKKARRKYSLEVIKLIRPLLIKRLSTHQKLDPYSMLKHNFKISLRNYLKHRSSFLINLTGLASGLTCVLLIYLWVDSELKMDKFHQNGNRLYQILANSSTSNGILTDEATPGLLAETMVEKLPEVESAVMESWTNTYTLSHQEIIIKAVGQYASEDYFRVFSYELLQGSRDEVLSEKMSIVISDELALKLFGTTIDVVGKTISFQQFRNYQVSGIFKAPPKSSSHQFDFIMTMGEFIELNSWILNWKNNGPSTFVVLSKDTDPEEFNIKIKDFIKDHNGESNITPIATLYSDLYLNGKYENGKPVGGRITYVKLFSLVALFVLGIACINFMNLSTARVSRRAKEIGVKKAVGANRSTLIFQFLIESILMTFIAMILALLLIGIVLPEFNQITDKQLELHLTRELIFALLSVFLITGIVAGSYPAFYLSNLKPVSILKSHTSGSLRELWMRKGLVIVQFSISIILIVSVMVLHKQIEFTQQKHIGFNRDNILYFEAEGEIELNMESFIDLVRNVPGVTKASSSAHSLVEGGYSGLTNEVKWEGKNLSSVVPMEYLRINYDLLEMMEFEIVAGRTFSKDFKSEYNKVVFNETAIEIMGLSNPVGATVNIWGEDTQIVGVAKDFHFKTFHKQVGPAFFVLKPDDTWLIMARIQTGRENETIASLEALYKDFNPNFHFDYKFLDQDYQAQYASEQRFATLSGYFSSIAIIISCLGLLGLATYSAERRTKEIGIRKILGSSLNNIIVLLSRDFTSMVVIAILIAIPVSYFLTSNWLESFAYRISLEWWFFVMAGAAALIVAWLTVGFQTLKAATINPVDCLRNE